MGWLDDLISAPGRVLCTATGGHDYIRIGRALVCSFCGHRP